MKADDIVFDTLQQKVVSSSSAYDTVFAQFTTQLAGVQLTSGFQDKAVMGASALVNGKKLPTSEAVAAVGYAAMQRRQRVVIPGFMNWLMAQSVRFTPRRLVTTIVKLMSRPVQQVAHLSA